VEFLHFRTRMDSTQPLYRRGLGIGIVVTVIACLCLLPALSRTSEKNLNNHASEASAIRSIQAITQAQQQYESTYPANGFACSLASLGGDPSAGAPSPAAAQIIPGDLASGFNSGYLFTIGCKDKMTINSLHRYNSYTVTAVPQTVGKTGNRGFCGDQFGTIKTDPAGGANCTQPLQ
jgi:type IV pilus assembly protein PilA